MNTPALETLLTIEQVAEILAVNERMIRRLIEPAETYSSKSEGTYDSTSTISPPPSTPEQSNRVNVASTPASETRKRR